MANKKEIKQTIYVPGRCEQHDKRTEETNEQESSLLRKSFSDFSEKE